jgi:hypothetical protein
LFLENTAIGKTSAFKEQRWSGKYSSGEFQTTRLKMIAPIPAKERIPNMAILIAFFAFLKRKYRAVIIPTAKTRETM